MSKKLGFTWYPKDWWTSDTFFKLPPELRYIFIEITSMMYMNNGVWKPDRIELLKRFGVDVGEKGFAILEDCFLVAENGEWTSPSVTSRITRAAAGGKRRAAHTPRDEYGRFQQNYPSKSSDLQPKEKEKGNINKNINEIETENPSESTLEAYETNVSMNEYSICKYFNCTSEELRSAFEKFYLHTKAKGTEYNEQNKMVSHFKNWLEKIGIENFKSKDSLSYSNYFSK